MPTTSIFLFSRLILNIIEQNTAKQFLDLEKMQFFIIFENLFKLPPFGPLFAPVFACFGMNCYVDLLDSSRLFHVCKFSLVAHSSSYKMLD